MAEETNEQVKINNEVKYVFVGEKSFEILARSYDTFFFLPRRAYKTLIDE